MANVMFKKGLSGSLPWTGAAEGTFYLTSDTNRLYVGKADNTLAELNRYVTVVATTSALPTNPAKDDFVYIAEGNILAVCVNPDAEATIDKWRQINPDTDTDTDTYLKSASAAVSTPETGGIKVDLTFKETKKNVKSGAASEVATPITTSFTISAEDLKEVYPVNVGVDVGSVASGAKIELNGDGHNSADKTVNIVGGSNVTITPDSANHKITVAATDTTYDLTAANNKLTLKGTNSTTDDVVIETSNDALTATAAGNKINYTHKEYTTTKSTNNGTDNKPSHGGNFTVIDGITTDKGHVTGYNVKTVTLPADQNYTYSVTGVELDKDDASKLKVSLTGANGGSSSSKTSDSLFYYMVNGTQVSNQGSIEFYTKAEIDKKIHDVDAMTYKGTVGTGATVTSLPTSGVKNGDTYKVATAGTYGTHSCDVGDLLIATGTETNGVITSGLAWTYVPSGDDTDTQYDLTSNGTKIVLTNKLNSADKDEVEFKAGTDLVVAADTNGGIKYSHASYDAVTPGTATGATPANGGKFTVVDSITTSNGHVTGYKTKEVTLPTITPTTSTLKAAANGVIQLDESIGNDSSVTIAAGNDIEVTTTTAGTAGKITVKHADFTTTPDPQAAGTLSHGGKFTVVQAITADNGHVTGYETKEWTLPADQNATYSLNGAAATVTGGVKVTHTLDGSNGGSDSTSVIGYVSDNLTIATKAAGTGEDARLSINFEWGTF